MHVFDRNHIARAHLQQYGHRIVGEMFDSEDQMMLWLVHLKASSSNSSNYNSLEDAQSLCWMVPVDSNQLWTPQWQEHVFEKISSRSTVTKSNDEHAAATASDRRMILAIVDEDGAVSFQRVFTGLRCQEE